MLNSVTRQPLTEEVLEKMKGLLISGEIPVGQRLPAENQLVEMLGISRATVREVLITLQAEGYIEIKRGKGAFVIDKDEFDRKKFIEWFQKNKFIIQEIIEVRMAIEPLAASLAAIKITDEQLTTLEEIHGKFETAIKKRKLDDIVNGDESFHETIMEASGNGLLCFIYRSIIPVLHDYRRSVFSPPADPTLAIQAHENIYMALKNKDPQAVSEAMLSHIRASQTDVVGTFNAIYSTLPQNEMHSTDKLIDGDEG